MGECDFALDQTLVPFMGFIDLGRCDLGEPKAGRLVFAAIAVEVTLRHVGQGFVRRLSRTSDGQDAEQNNEK